jgi:hypothetical protein
MPIGAEANATGFEISSSMLSNIPQNLLKGSKVSGIPPRCMKDSSDEEDETSGEREL